MTRAKGDHQARRRDVSEAVWRVLAVGGFRALTIRAVAAELGATTGTVTHYFSGKRDLIATALRLLEERSGARTRRTAEAGLPALRATVLDMLAISDEAVAVNRIWVSSWDIVLADPRLRANYAAKYAAGRVRLEHLVQEAQGCGHLPSGSASEFAADLHAFALGLTVQALLDPEAFPANRQIELLDRRLADAEMSSPGLL